MNYIKSKLLAVLFAASLSLGARVDAQDATGLGLARQLNEAFVQVAEQVSSSVVVLSVVQKAQPPTEAEKQELDALPPAWREFHKRFRDNMPDRSLGQGSGVIIRKDGYILTNRHVVEDAETINVRLQDGRKFKATIQGVDRQSDVAVIKIDAEDLPVARLADSSRTRVGEFAIAIGAPFSLDYSVTFGHVSAKGRSNIIDGLEGASMDQDFIQTDAQINPGNSGGPLVNINGEVIGINTLIRGLQTGIGFAIPSSLAKEVSDQLIAQGKFVRPWLGVAIRALRDQPEVQELLKDVDDGVVVSQVLPGGPAAKSELRRSDIITSVDGTRVATPQELRAALRPKPIGQPVVLEVYRSGKRIEVKVSPAEWVQAETRPARARTQGPTPRRTEPSKLGISVQTLTPELAASFGLETQEGVLVSSVQENSAAAKRVKAGDVIVSVNQQPVGSPKEFQEALKRADPNKGILLSLISDKNARFEVVKE